MLGWEMALAEDSTPAGDSESEGSENKRGILDWFRKCFRFHFAAYSLPALLFLSLGYGILILTHVVPSKCVWGGRLKSNSSMLRFGAVSLCLNLFFLLFVVLRAQLFCTPACPPNFCLKVLRWISCIINLMLDTMGNLLAKSWFEMLTFPHVTSYVSIAFARLALGDMDDSDDNEI